MTQEQDVGYHGHYGGTNYKDDYYKLAKKWGAEVLPPRSSMGPDIGMPGGALGGDFLFDYHYKDEGFVQLIIGKPHVKDATKLLHHFDIEICKCAFSASKVYIPAAVETFAGRTFITPARHALADSFMKALNQVKPTFPDGTCTYDGSEMPKVLAKMSNQVWKGIGLPSYNGAQYDFEHKCTVIVRLFERIPEVPQARRDDYQRIRRRSRLGHPRAASRFGLRQHGRFRLQPWTLNPEGWGSHGDLSDSEF